MAEPKADDIYLEAITELGRLIEEACRRGDAQARTCALATCGPDARPSVRVVGVVRISEGGLAIFVDTKTGKGKQLQANPRAALCFHWPALEYQAIVEGSVEWLSESSSDELWVKQPREFGLAHMASDQMASSPGAEELRRRVHEIKRAHEFERVQRPSNWRAFELKPDRIDLWPTGWERLRARLHYSRSANGAWSLSRQSP